MLKLRKNIISFFLSPDELKYKDSLEYWRARIYFSLSLALLLFSTVAYIPSMIVSIRHQVWGVAFLDTTAYVLLLIIFFFRSIPFKLRVYGILFIIYLLGVVLLVLLGPIGAGIIWLFAFPILAGILLSYEAVLACIAINSSTLLLLGLLLYLGVFKESLMKIYNIDSWSITAINFICLNMLTTIPIAVLVRGLERSLLLEKEIKNLLKQEQEKLKDNNHELTKINIDLDNFIYTASHDLKAPIINIEGLLQLLNTELKDCEDKDILLMIEMMQTSIDRFKQVIMELADISRIQKSYEEDKEEVDIRTLIDEVQLSLINQINEADTKLVIHLDEDKIKFSKRNFRSILYNLISNAVKYRSQLRPSVVQITTKEEEGCLILIVKDNGLGMPPGFEHKIFKMFRRMHNHRDGSGVGLYIVKRIVENAEGKIEVTSELDKGSEFRIYLKNEVVKKI